MSAAVPGPRVSSVGAAKSSSDGTSFSAIRLAFHSRRYLTLVDAERYLRIRRNLFITARGNGGDQDALPSLSARKIRRSQAEEMSLLLHAFQVPAPSSADTRFPCKTCPFLLLSLDGVLVPVRTCGVSRTGWAVSRSWTQTGVKPSQMMAVWGWLAEGRTLFPRSRQVSQGPACYAPPPLLADTVDYYPPRLVVGTVNKMMVGSTNIRHRCLGTPQLLLNRRLAGKWHVLRMPARPYRPPAFHISMISLLVYQPDTLLSLTSLPDVSFGFKCCHGSFTSLLLFPFESDLRS